MRKPTYAMNILLENLSFNEKQKLFALEEAALDRIDNELMIKLYDGIVKKSHVDFADIPTSKGNIEKYKHYDSMMESIDIVERLLKTNSKSSIELTDLKNCIHYVSSNAKHFERAFKTNNEFVKLLYCVIVASCIEATTLLLTNYIDFVKYPTTREFTINPTPGNMNSITFNTIRQFNASVANGSLMKSINVTDPIKQESFIAVLGGLSAAVIAILAVIPLIREAIFYFFHSRVKITDFLEYQRDMVELNKQRLSGSSKTINERNKIMKRQDKIIDTLTTLADRIRVNSTVTERVVKDNIKKENLELPNTIKKTPSSSGMIF